MSRFCSLSQGLDYWWVETARFQTESHISTLAWNNEGQRLITAGEVIQMWQHDVSPEAAEGNAAKFEIGPGSAAADLKISEIVDVPNWVVSCYLPISVFG